MMFRGSGFKASESEGSTRALQGLKFYLDPKEPTFLGFLIMVSLYKPLKTQVIWV